MSPPRFCLLLVLLSALAPACSHYKLGKPGDPSAPVLVWIDPVVLEVPLSGVAIPLNRELREAVIRNGSLMLAGSADEADRVIRVSVSERQRESLARRSTDTGLSDDLSLELVADFELVNEWGEVLEEGRISVTGQIFRDVGFGESTRQRMPAMLRDLANDILQASFLDW